MTDFCPSCGKLFAAGVVYMVHDHLWQQSKLEGWACIFCFEKAMGRRIQVSDLKPEPLCNHFIPLGWFLGDRRFGEMI